MSTDTSVEYKLREDEGGIKEKVERVHVSQKNMDLKRESTEAVIFRDPPPNSCF